MANSKFTITFLAMPDVNDEIHIGESTLGLDIKQIFRNLRLAMYQTKIPASYDIGEVDPIIIHSGYVSNNYKTSFNLDFNSTGLFTITSDNGTIDAGLGSVTVEANYPGAVFVDNNTLPSIMEVVIENEAAPTPINIDSVVFSEAATNPCQNVKVTVETDVLATKIISPIAVDPNTDNPFEFEALRGASLTITVENSEGSQATQSIQVPVALNASNFAIGISNSPNGATVTITNVLSTGLVLEYSLDGSTWQTSNIFSGLVADDYTLHVRDQLGCSFTLDFNVNDNAIYTPVFYYSKSNGLRLAERITWGDAANYKTDENTLSCEVEVNVPFHEKHFKQSADIETYQFKSNYTTNEVNVIRENNTSVSVPVTKKSDYIGVKDKRDARKYNLGNGKVGIYFTSGNLYDYNTNAVTGTHALNGLLPEWGIVGNYIEIGGSWFLIEQTLFDDTKNSDVLVITETYTGVEIDVITGCIYNIFDYEIYEFTIDYLDYVNETVKVELIVSDPNFTTRTFISEDVDIKVRQEDTVCIDYWNNDNNDVFYATGIRHRIRMPYTKVEGNTDEDSSIHKTDTNAILLSAELYEGDKFIFEPTTKEMWRKLMMALSHKNVFLDGVKYVKNGEFETEGPLEESNLYVLTAKMLKSGNIYNSDGSTFGAGNASNVNIPGIVQGNGSFVKY